MAGVGIILQFTVVEGIVKPGMKFEVEGAVFTIGQTMYAFASDSDASHALLPDRDGGPGSFKPRYREVTEAKSTDGVIQAVLKTTASHAEAILRRDKTGLFVLEG